MTNPPRRLRTILPLLILALFAALVPTTTGASSARVPTASTDSPRTDRLIIQLRPSSSLSVQAERRPERVADQLGATVGVELDYVRPLGDDAHVMSLSAPLSEAEVAALATELARLPDLDGAVPDSILYPTIEPTERDYGLFGWHLQTVNPGNYGANLPAAWEITTGAPGVVTAIVDTGGLLTHEDLVGRTPPGNPGYDLVADPVRAGDGDGRDPDPSDTGDFVTQAETGGGGSLGGCRVSASTWHGSHVAGTIGATANNGRGMAGINWVSPILHVRALAKCGGYVSDIADGLRWAAGLPVYNLPTNANHARVLNLSLGGSGVCNSYFQQAINDVSAAGSIVVVAAGNENRNAAESQPGNCEGVITVAATSRTGNKAGYSNYGPVVELAAPGGDSSVDSTIYSTINSGDFGPERDDYGFYQGTSMATPHVSGIISLMLSANPGLNGADLLAILQSTATPFPGGSTCAGRCGAGIVNAGAAVEEAARRVRMAGFTTDNSIVSEEVGLVSLPVSLSLPSNQPVFIPFTVGGSAGPEDHSLVTGGLTIPAGAKTGTITFTINNDAVAEPAETLVITLGAGERVGRGIVATHTLTINDNDAFPAAALSPTTLTFGSTPVGEVSGAQAITLSNAGGVALSLSNIAASGDFARTGGSCPTTFPANLAVGASCTIEVAFVPTASGTRPGALTVTSDAPSSPKPVTLSGTGLASGLSFSPASLAFGSQRVGTTSEPLALVVRSMGELPLTLTGFSTGTEFTRTGGSCPTTFPATLAVGTSCTVELRFAPTRTGIRGGTLLVTGNLPGGARGVSLSGTGTIPAIGFGPTSLSFDPQRVGTTSAPRTVTMTNPGTAPLRIAGLATSAGVALAGGSCTTTGAFTLAPGANCTIALAFTPESVGDTTGALTVTSDVPGGPYSVRLRGTGLAPALDLDTTALRFGGQQVGTTSAPRAVTLSNTGTAPLRIDTINLGAGAFSRTNGSCATSFPFTLAPGALCTVELRFAPTTLGASSTTLNITSDAPEGNQTVALTGVGTAGPAPSLHLTPYNLSFNDTTAITEAKPQTITLSNLGATTLTVNTIGITGQSFSRVGGTCTTVLPLTLGPGVSCTITMGFTAPTGEHSGALTVTSDALDSPHRVTLAGQVPSPAGPSVFGIDSAELRYDDTTVTVRFAVTNGGGAGSTQATYTMTADRNVADADLIVTAASVTFAAGDTSKIVTLTFDRLALFGAQALVVALDEPNAKTRPGPASTVTLPLPDDMVRLYLPVIRR